MQRLFEDLSLGFVDGQNVVVTDIGQITERRALLSIQQIYFSDHNNTPCIEITPRENEGMRTDISQQPCTSYRLIHNNPAIERRS